MTADLAVIAMAVVALASIGRDYRVHMKVADRMRLVSPPAAKKEAAPPAGGKDAAQPGAEVKPITAARGTG